MKLQLEEEFSKTPIVQEIDALKKQIDAIRPLPVDVEGRVMQKFRLDWNYHSNAIEGNKLTHGETTAFLMEGITAKGKPLKDHLDIRGHNEAIDFLLALIKDERPLTENDIRELHEMILVEPYKVSAETADGTPTSKMIYPGKYKTMPNHVKTATGFIHYYATPEETPIKMQELMDWYHSAIAALIHPVVIAALFHHKFVAIHPFDDGNGRMSRILMNLILMGAGFTPVVIKQDDRLNYYSLLSRADNNEAWPFVEYISNLLVDSMNLYLKAANGGDIDEEGDIDKELTLLKAELRGGSVVKEKKTYEIVAGTLYNELIPLSFDLSNKLGEFKEFFFNSDFKIVLSTFDPFLNSLLEHHFRLQSESRESIYMFFIENTVKDISLYFDFIEYKNPDKSFNISVNIDFLFTDYHYKIKLGDVTLISHLYHESLKKEDIYLVIKNAIRQFKIKFRDLQNEN